MEASIVVASISGLVAAGSMVMTYRSSTRATKATERLGESSEQRQWVTEARIEAREARKEAQESRERAERIRDEANTDVARVRIQLTEIEDRLSQANLALAKLTDTLTSVAAEVWRPEPDIPALRRLVGRPQGPGINGRPL